MLDLCLLKGAMPREDERSKLRRYIVSLIMVYISIPPSLQPFIAVPMGCPLSLIGELSGDVSVVAARRADGRLCQRRMRSKLSDCTEKGMSNDRKERGFAHKRHSSEYQKRSLMVLQAESAGNMAAANHASRDGHRKCR
jgi:hypothetical protein